MAHHYIFTMVTSQGVPPQRRSCAGSGCRSCPAPRSASWRERAGKVDAAFRIMAASIHDSRGTLGGRGNPHRLPLAGPAPRPVEKRLGNVEEAVASTRALLHRFDELNEKLASDLSEAESDKLMAEYQRVQDAIEASNAWELDRQLEVAMDALRLPPGEADVATLSGGERRRVALCKVLLERRTPPLASRRTTRAGPRVDERHIAGFPNVVAVTHDGTSRHVPVDPRARRGAGYSGRATIEWLAQKKRGSASRKQQSAPPPLQREREWVGWPRARATRKQRRLER